ncbi:MAG: HdeD family acid-resistance protein, partial [Mycobacterium sp.]
MQPTAVPTLLPHLWKSTLVSGILALALGILTLVWPGKTILVAAGQVEPLLIVGIANT